MIWHTTVAVKLRHRKFSKNEAPDLNEHIGESADLCIPIHPLLQQVSTVKSIIPC